MKITLNETKQESLNVSAVKKISPLFKQKYTSALRLSIVIPCYNESNRFPILKNGVQEFLHSHRSYEVEIILVNDGSADNTSSLLKRFKNDIQLEFPETAVKVCDLEKNQGKGAALQEGVKTASGNWILTVDADMATPLTQMNDWVSKFDAIEDSDSIYIGSRRNKNSQNSFLREVLSKGFSFINKTMFGIPANDTQCGFKLYPSALAKVLFRKMGEKGWAHDVELLYKVRKLGYRIRSLDVHWQEVEGSKINVLWDPLRMFGAILKIRLSRWFY